MYTKHGARDQTLQPCRLLLSTAMRLRLVLEARWVKTAHPKGAAAGRHELHVAARKLERHFARTAHHNELLSRELPTRHRPQHCIISDDPPQVGPVLRRERESSLEDNHDGKGRRKEHFTNVGRTYWNPEGQVL